MRAASPFLKARVWYSTVCRDYFWRVWKSEHPAMSRCEDADACWGAVPICRGQPCASRNVHGWIVT